MLDITEYRYLNGWSDNSKRGSSRYERIPTDIIEEIYINNLWDYTKLIPENLPIVFTAKDFEKEAGISINAAQTALNILTYIGVVERVGIKGKAFIYNKKTLDF